MIARTALAVLAATALTGTYAAAASVTPPMTEIAGKAWPGFCPAGRPGAPGSPGSLGSAEAADQAPALAAIQFAGPARGWVAGAGRVLATRDGGRRWARQYHGRADLNQVDFIDGEHGWAAGGRTLLRTTDGGARWSALAAPCGSQFVAVHFVSPRVGYAVLAGAPGAAAAGLFTSARGGSLVRTANGGRTWTRVAGAPGNPQSACFASAADGYLGTPGRIWRSTNGGRSWTLALTEPQPPSGGTPQTRDTPEIECGGASGAWVLFLGVGAAMEHAPYLAYTTRDGRAWHAMFEERYTESGLRPGLDLPEGPGSYPGPFSAISASTAAFVGFTPPAGNGIAPLEIASHGGYSLARKGHVAVINQPVATAFLSSAQGWVVGENLRTGAYSVEATANSGRSWTTQYTTG